jgi:hypothetical protein
MMVKSLFAALALISASGCSMPEPKPIARLLSPDGKAELALFHDEPGGTIDDNLLVTVNKRGMSYDRNHLRASIKRARHLHLYWTVEGRPVLAASDYEGWISSSPSISEGIANLILCDRAAVDCEVALPSHDVKHGIRRDIYLSGESTPF